MQGIGEGKMHAGGGVEAKNLRSTALDSKKIKDKSDFCSILVRPLQSHKSAPCDLHVSHCRAIIIVTFSAGLRGDDAGPCAAPGRRAAQPAAVAEAGRRGGRQQERAWKQQQ